MLGNIFARARFDVLLWNYIILFVHPVTATRTLDTNKNYQHTIISMAKNSSSSMGSFTFWMSLQKSEEVGPCRCCIFSHYVSCSSVCIICPTTLAAAVKRCPYIYTRTRLRLLLIIWFFCCYVYLQYVVLLSSFQSKVVFVVPPFLLQHFMPFSYGFLDSCQYTNKVGAFYCRWCWALCKYRRTVIALTAVVLLTTAIGGAHANDALYLVFWLWRCNFSFILFPSAACCLWLFHSCCFCLLFWPGL